MTKKCFGKFLSLALALTMILSCGILSVAAFADDEESGSLEVGDTYVFGTYEQDGKKKNGPEDIEWEVLAVEDGKALLISKKGLDCQPFHIAYEDVSWENSSLRTWLNDYFYNEAFTEEEQGRIITTEIPGIEYPDYDYMESTEPTEDNVFILSREEAEQYLDGNNARRCLCTKEIFSTDYFPADAWIHIYWYWFDEYIGDSWWDYSFEGHADIADHGGFCRWWLRSSGWNTERAAYVDYDGEIIPGGRYVNTAHNRWGIAVRPVIWIDVA